MGLQAAVLDVYDDKGALLRQFFTDPGQLPDIVKTASPVRDDAPDSTFALVGREGDGPLLRKFPTHDAGNTVLSLLYFGETHEKLGQDLRIVAAAELELACGHYGLPVPALVAHIADHLVGDYVAPVQEGEKVASEDEYALQTDDGPRYPLRSAKDVSTADSYFQRHHKRFRPQDRHAFATKVASVAARFGLPLSDILQESAGDDWNDDACEYIEARRQVMLREEARPEAFKALDKLASAVGIGDKVDFVEALDSFDRHTRLNRYYDRFFPDAYGSTFGKVAEGAEIAKPTWRIGEVSVSQDELKLLSTHSRGIGQFREHFGEAAAAQFVKDPLAVFESMPAPSKKIIARLAGSLSDFQ